MDEKIWPLLFTDVRTLEEAYLLDDELKTVEQATYSIGDKGNDPEALMAYVKDKISYKTYTKLQALIERNMVNFRDVNQLHMFFDQAHKQIMNIPRLQIQIAIEANDSLITAIYSWVKREVHDVVFLELITKPALIGGCVIVYEGMYKDYSVKYKLESDPKKVFEPIMHTIDEQLSKGVSANTTQSATMPQVSQSN
jgi:F0F1-type ATP synthase delta subunit